MKETPIIMSGNSPTAILDDKKTQTRRVIKLACELDNAYDHKWVRFDTQDNWWLYKGRSRVTNSLESFVLKCPYGQAGDRLWVRETWIPDPFHPSEILYKVNSNALIERVLKSQLVKWKPSIFMPRRASRILLEITEIRVERLQEITEGDAKAEGADYITLGKEYSQKFGWLPRDSFRAGFWKLWDSLNAKRGYGWETNPWVWVISFVRLK